MSAIALHAAAVRLGERVVLHEIAFSAGPGEIVALCGPNGAGKTTLLRALAGLVVGFPSPDPRRVAYVAQGARSSWGLSVAELVALGRIPHRDSAAAKVAEAMELCGIGHLRLARVDRISGGEARRAMLARAFATDPEVLLLDEPTADLDPAAAHEIMRLLRRTADAGKTVVIVLHALDLALAYADRVSVLREGRIVADRPARDALADAAAAFGLPYGVDPAPRLLPPV
ncbi:MAG: ABC transporter ATP-binding protein [Acetobacteraceae bacterium]|nr:ABC transporter ATP-binding protein [Acetobacteraceae bacterium]